MKEWIKALEQREEEIKERMKQDFEENGAYYDEDYAYEDWRDNFSGRI